MTEAHQRTRQGRQTSAHHGVFVSFAAEDRAWAEGFLLTALRQAGVDYSTEDMFRPGVPLVQELERTIARSERVVLVLSPAYLADPSRQLVPLLSQQYGFETATWPVVSIVLHDTDLPLSLSLLTRLDATERDNWESCLDRLLRDLKRELPGAEAPPACPYPGMVAFTEQDSERFYGRSAEIEEIVQRLALHPWLAVIGPSGSGKSSVVHAGVEPRLRAAGFAPICLRPGATPYDSLKSVLSRLDDVGPVRTLLVVDQLEELFTVAAAPQAELFCAELVNWSASTAMPCIVTARADFYPQLMTSALWSAVRDHRFEIVPLRGAQLREAVVAPAAALGVYLESALVDRLIRDAAAEPGSLPLIQETLVLLWQRLVRRFLPISAYDALVLPTTSYGEAPRTGLQVALARRADAAMADLATDADRRTARRIFLRLVQLMDGRDDVRRQVRCEDLRSDDDDPERFDAVLEGLTRARLLTSTTDRNGDGEDVLIDLAHEAIIAGWPALGGWIAERRAAERVRRQLEATAQTWVALGRGSGGLLDDVELTQARHWMHGPDGVELGASSNLADLVSASDQALTAARARSRRLNLLFRGLSAALACLLVAVVGVAVAAVDQRDQAQEGRRLARSGELALTAASLPGEQLDRALLLAREAVAVRDTARSRAGLLAALRSNPRVVRILHGAGPLLCVAASSDGRLAVAGGADGTVRSWDLRSGAPAGPVKRLTGEIRSLALSPDARSVAASTSTGVVATWDLATGNSGVPVTAASGHAGSVRVIRFSPDGSQLVTGGQDGRVIVADVRSGRVLRVLTGYRDWVNAVAFTPDGAQLVVGGGRTEGLSTDRRILVWDLATGALRHELAGHADAIRALALTPDGARLASAGADDVVKVWDLATGRLLRTLSGHTERVFDVAYSADGRLLASAGRDHDVRLWDPSTGLAAGEPLRAHGDSVRGIAFSGPDRLLSVGNDGRLFVWAVGDRPRSRLATALTAQQGPTRAVAVDPSGRLIAAGGDDGRVVLRRASDGAPSGGSIQVAGHVSGLAFGPGGRTLATATFEGSVRVWDVATGLPRTPAVDTGDGSVVVAVSPDGRFVVTGGDGNVVRVWDPSLHKLGTLSGHANWIRALAFRPSDGALVSGGADGVAWLWTSLPSGPGRPLTVRTSPMWSVAFSPDGRTVAAGNSEGEVVFWDASATEAVRLNRPALTGHVGPVTAVAYDPTGRWIVTADQQGTLRLWDAGAGFELWGSLGNVGAVSAAQVAGGGSSVLAGGASGATLWDTNLASWQRTACIAAGRGLTGEEARRYLAGLPVLEPCAGPGGG